MEILGIAGIVIILGSFLYAFIRKAPLSLALAIAFLIIYAIFEITKRVWDVSVWASGYTDLVLVHLETWRVEEIIPFFTTMFVHHNLLHLGFNTMALILIGMPLEDRIGTAAFTIAFIIGGLIGTLTFYLIHYFEYFILLGASGAIAAELGVFARLYPRQRMVLFVPFLAMPAIPVIWVAIGFLLLSSLLVYVVPGIAHEAHIGGLITGFLIAPLLSKIPSKRVTVTKRIDIDALQSLANTSELQDILHKIRTESLSEVREAWIERFVQLARCPQCDGPLRLSLGRIVSDCGWKTRLR